MIGTNIMDTIRIVKKSKHYTVAVLAPLERVAPEIHYGVINNNFEVVEFRTTVLTNALKWLDEVEGLYSDNTEEEYFTDGETAH